MFLLFIIFLFTYIFKTFYQERNKLFILIALFDFFDLVDFIRLSAHSWQEIRIFMGLIARKPVFGVSDQVMLKPEPQGYKTFFMLNSTEPEISSAHKT